MSPNTVTGYGYLEFVQSCLTGGANCVDGSGCMDCFNPSVTNDTNILNRPVCSAAAIASFNNLATIVTSATQATTVVTPTTVITTAAVPTTATTIVTPTTVITTAAVPTTLATTAITPTTVITTAAVPTTQIVVTEPTVVVSTVINTQQQNSGSLMVPAAFLLLALLVIVF